MNIKNNKNTYISILLAATLLVGCGSSSSGSSKNSGTGNIDLANYFPTKDMSKTFTTVEGNTTDFTPGTYSDAITVVKENNITTITTTDEDGDNEKLIIDDKNITQISDGLNFSSYRHVNLGDTFFKLQDKETEEMKQSGLDYATVTKELNLECTIDEQLKEFKKGEHKYSGDILKIKCIDNGKLTIDVNPAIVALAPEMFKDINGTHDNYDVSYHYFKKGMGEVASIDDDCILVSKEPKWQNDREQECIEKYHDYEYYVEPKK